MTLHFYENVLTNTHKIHAHAHTHIHARKLTHTTLTNTQSQSLTKTLKCLTTFYESKNKHSTATWETFAGLYKLARHEAEG